MEDYIFYRKYANTPLDKRDISLSSDTKSPVCDMTLTDVYAELNKIGDKIRPDIIRQEKLLSASARYLEEVTMSKDDYQP